MKAITVHQPWAALIAHGHKTIETRPSPPNGPMRPEGVRGYPGLALERGERIAIHAGHLRSKADVRKVGMAPYEPLLSGDGLLLEHPLAFSAIVATAVVETALPILTEEAGGPGPEVIRFLSPFDGGLLDCRRDGASWAVHGHHHDDLPLGDFTPGRWGWLLNDVRRIEPVPCSGRQGVWALPMDVHERVNIATALRNEEATHG